MDPDTYNIGVWHGHETGELPKLQAVGRGYPAGGTMPYKNGVIERFDVDGAAEATNIDRISYWFRPNPTKEQLKRDERPPLQYVTRTIDLEAAKARLDAVRDKLFGDIIRRSDQRSDAGMSSYFALPQSQTRR